MKDKFGNELTTKEFFQRWKMGIQKVTPLQQMKVNLIGNSLVLCGVIVGLITTFILKVWWLFIILSGSLFLSSMGFLSNLQKYWVFKKINQEVNKIENEK